MKSCLILGAARSGTSLTAGCLAKSGYFMGDDLMKPRDGNPAGFFEDYHINGINDRILLTTQSGALRHFPGSSSLAGRWFGRHHKWLLSLTPGKEIVSTEKQREEIAELVQKAPYCFKDPRFCYTLPVWKMIAKEAVFVCVFRHPAQCAESIVRESMAQQQTREMNITNADALQIYQAMYERVIKEYRGTDSKDHWLFLHYQQILEGDGVSRLSAFLEADTDYDFPDRTLYRNRVKYELPDSLKALYNELCHKAGFTDRDHD